MWKLTSIGTKSTVIILYKTKKKRYIKIETIMTSAVRGLKLSPKQHQPPLKD